MARWTISATLLTAMLGHAVADGPALTPQDPAAKPPGNTCVECHQRTDTIRALPPWRHDQFLHWYGSVHGRDDVTCEKCHGGDPARTDKDLAHQGVGPTKDPTSRIYYKNLPETCGSCHAEVRDQFAKSTHFDNLKADKLAPSCTTCHGFQMDIATVVPDRLAARCAVCHNAEEDVSPWIPGRTRDLLQGALAARDEIRRAQVALDLAEKKGTPLVEADRSLRAARERLAGTGALWHRFELSEFKQELKEIRALADKAYEAARRVVVGK